MIKKTIIGKSHRECNKVLDDNFQYLDEQKQSKITISAVAPSNPKENDIWFDIS